MASVCYRGPFDQVSLEPANLPPFIVRPSIQVPNLTKETRMASVRYLGPFDQVSLEPANLPPFIVDLGGTVDVPAELAAELVLQDCWETADAPKGRKSTTPADPPAAA